MEEKSFAKQMQDDIWGDVIENIGPEINKKLGKFIAPAVKELEKELDGCIFQLKQDKETGYMFFIVLEERTIDEFKITENPKLVVPIKNGTEFIEKLLRGELFKNPGQV